MSATIHQVRVHNFQSLQDVTIDLKPFTVVVGPSSSGKSAFARALRTLATNRRGTDWITHGERQASITAVTNHGTVTLTRSRTASGENAYVVTPEGHPEGQRTYSKLGGATPEDVSRFLGIASQTPLNFAGQFDKPFLLDDSATEVARTLGALTNVHVIFNAARESNRRKLAAAQELKTRTGDLEAIKARVPEFRALKEQDAALVEAESRIESARSTTRQIARLISAINAIEVIEPALEDLERRAAVVVPDESAAVRALEALRSFEQAIARVSALGKAQEAAQEAYTASEAEEARLLDQYTAVTGKITSDLRGFFTSHLNPALTREQGTFVEVGHAVDVFVQYLELRNGA